MEIKKLKEIMSSYTFRTFVIYVIIGFMGLSIDVGLYLLLIRYFGFSPYVANLISMIVSINNNFFWNTVYNFKKTDQLFRRWVQFVSIGVLGIFISEALIYIFIEVLSLGDDIAKYATIPIIAVIQYILHRLFTYK